MVFRLGKEIGRRMGGDMDWGKRAPNTVSRDNQARWKSEGKILLIICGASCLACSEDAAMPSEARLTRRGVGSKGKDLLN